jgi:hypothetical protein
MSFGRVKMRRVNIPDIHRADFARGPWDARPQRGGFAFLPWSLWSYRRRVLGTPSWQRREPEEVRLDVVVLQPRTYGSHRPRTIPP